MERIAQQRRDAEGRASELDELEHQRDLLVAATESALDAVMVTDPAGLIQYVNAAFERITGYTRAEALGRTMQADSSAQIGPQMAEEDLAALERQQSWHGRLVSHRKDGTPFQEACSVATVTDGTGQRLGMVYIRRDITERLRLETAANEMVNMGNLGAVFSGIRHEIGNPINSTKSILTLLRANLDRYPAEKVQDYLTRALEKMSQVEYLLRTLKSFNMFESPQLQPLELAPFLELLSDLISRDLIEQGIRVSSRIGPGAKRCMADPRALQQVLLNLLANAAEALDDVADPTIEIRVERRGPDVRILVEDNGRGMTPGQQDELFKPFQTSKPEGTGLGLILARKLLAAMDGTLALTSSAGRGTTAVVTLGGVREDEP